MGGLGWLDCGTAREREIGAVISRGQSDAELEIVWLIVDAGARRHGVIQGLVAAAMEGAVFDGHRNVSARVPAGQSGLFHLFLGLGFVPVGASASNLGEEDDEPIIVLERQLGDCLDDELMVEGEPSRLVAAPKPFEREGLAP